MLSSERRQLYVFIAVTLVLLLLLLAGLALRPLQPFPVTFAPDTVQFWRSVPENERACGRIAGSRPLQLAHIPRTAGTSIEDLGQTLGVAWGSLDWRLPSTKSRYGWWWQPGVGRCMEWHTPPAVISQGYAGSEVFCVARDLFARAVSTFKHYYYVHAGGNTDFPPTGTCTAASLNAWIAGPYATGADPDTAGFLDCHALPQTTYMSPTGCTTVLRFERLVDELPELLRCRGLVNASQAVVLPRSKRGNELAAATRCELTVSDLTDASRQLLRRLYAVDFELLGRDA